MFISVTRRPALFVGLITSVMMASGTTGAENVADNRSSQVRVQDRDDLELASSIRAKQFCVALRRNHSPEKSAALREFIDPEYLEQHDLNGERFPIQTAPVVGISDIQLTDDPHTILCLVDTREHAAEAIILRSIIRNQQLYFSPVRAPDSETGSFTPWILRTPLKVP